MTIVFEPDMHIQSSVTIVTPTSRAPWIIAGTSTAAATSSYTYIAPYIFEPDMHIQSSVTLVTPVTNARLLYPICIGTSIASCNAIVNAEFSCLSEGTSVANSQIGVEVPFPALLAEGTSMAWPGLLGLHVAAITPTRYLQVQAENRLSVPPGRPRMLLPIIIDRIMTVSSKSRIMTVTHV
jgi:hypothetical protein